MQNSNHELEQGGQTMNLRVGPAPQGRTPLVRVGPDHLVEIGGFSVGRQQNISVTQKLDIAALFFD